MSRPISRPVTRIALVIAPAVALAVTAGCASAPGRAAVAETVPAAQTRSISPPPAPASASTPARAPTGSPAPGASRPAGPKASSAVSAVRPLPEVGVADYQLGGAYRPAAGVTVVSRDSTDNPAAGLYNICYVNGFQTQPQDRGIWLTGRRDLLLTDGSGKPVIDPEWPDEFIVDTSTAAKRTRIAAIINVVIQQCARRGYQAVEIDNLDTYSRSQGRLSMTNNLALAAALARAAHGVGLAIAQKNSAELASRGRKEAGFDFAVAEECHRYAECGVYRSVYGKRVVDIEYPDNLRGTFAQACADPARAPLTILRDRDLVTPADSDYVYRHC